MQSLKEVKDCQIAICGKLRGHGGTASPRDTLAVSAFKGHHLGRRKGFCNKSEETDIQNRANRASK